MGAADHHVQVGRGLGEVDSVLRDGLQSHRRVLSHGGGSAVGVVCLVNRDCKLEAIHMLQNTPSMS